MKRRVELIDSGKALHPDDKRNYIFTFIYVYLTYPFGGMNNNDLKMSRGVASSQILSNKIYDAISLRREPDYTYFEMQYFNATLYNVSYSAE